MSKEPQKPNRKAVDRAKVDYVVLLRNVLSEASRINRTVESLQAAEEVQDCINSALMKGGGM